MGQRKVFGGSKGSFSGSGKPVPVGEDLQPAAQKTKKEKVKKDKKPHSALRLPIVLLSLILLAEIGYCVCVFSNIPFIAKWRNIFVEMSLTSMSQEWLAEDLLPDYITDEWRWKKKQYEASMVGVESTWEDVEHHTRPQQTVPQEDATTPTDDEPLVTETKPDPAKEEFFLMFDELDVSSVEAYVAQHPEAVENGWENFYVNEAGTDNDDMTTMKTLEGDSVMAIDAANGVLIIRLYGDNYRGVLAICKDESRLFQGEAGSIGSSGQTIATIAKRHNALVAINGASFDDVNGVGNGGIVVGRTLCNGASYGKKHVNGYKRLELREDNRIYIRDSYTDINSATTDCMEFTPALIIDGKIVVDEYCGWNATNPRAILGQASNGDIMMMVIEGRLVGTSLGCGVVECARVLKNYGCYQAMNLDGGTSAMMGYEGACITLCSNKALPDGRGLPTAWIYSAVPLDD